MSARIVSISSLQDPRIEPYLRLRERDLARSDGLFVAEGEVVVRVLASPRQNRYAIHSLLIEERRVEALAAVLEQMDERVCVGVASQAVMDQIVGFPIYRGILALGERGVPGTAAEILGGGPNVGSARLAVGLVGLANHDNVGAIFRNAAAFGASGVLMDPTTCDPLYRKAIRVSVGAALLVPFARCASADAMIDAIEEAGWETLALSGRGEETLASAVAAPSPPCQVLLLGTEGKGLPEEILARTRRVRIDMDPTLDSLNVAVASGIALYEASRAKYERGLRF